MNPVTKKLCEIGLLPVIKLAHPDRDALPLADALCAGGVPAAEITFRAAGAERAISQMRKAHPEMLVGAEAVLTNANVDAAVAAGAQFIVTPGIDTQIIRYCQSIDLPVFPGCSTATDYHAAYRLGLEILKFFPAETSGGVEKIKALSAPFPSFKVMPTGGITLNNLRSYLSCPVVCACGGSYLAAPALVESGRWDEITDICRRSVEILKEVRSERAAH